MCAEALGTAGLFPHARERARPSDPHSEQPVSVGERVRVFSSLSVCVRPRRLSMCIHTSAAKIFPPSVVWSVCHAVVFVLSPASFVSSGAVGIRAKLVSFGGPKAMFWEIILSSMSVVA